MIKWYSVFSIALLGFFVLLPSESRAAACANGVYNAGCVGPNGAAVVHKTPYARPPSYYHPPSYYRPPARVTCVNGVYRAGCAGPNGAAVVHKNY
jgi:hypothetical protein